MEPMQGYRPSERRRRSLIRRKEMPLWQELPLLLIVACCLAVLIRTFLSMSLQLELEGRWPWQRAEDAPPKP